MKIVFKLEKCPDFFVVLNSILETLSVVLIKGSSFHDQGF